VSAEACAAGAVARAVSVARAGAERAAAAERRVGGAAFVAAFFTGALAAGSDGSAVVATGAGARGSGVVVVVTGVESITGSGTLACCASAGVDERGMTAAIAVRAVRDLRFFCVMRTATPFSRKRIRVSDETALAADRQSRPANRKGPAKLLFLRRLRRRRSTGPFYRRSIRHSGANAPSMNPAHALAERNDRREARILTRGYDRIVVQREEAGSGPSE
jgi:hypothetical protein